MHKDLSWCRLASGWLAVLFLMIGMAASGQPVASTTVQEYVFLIDTSSSMSQNRLVGPLRVAVDDFADKIPVDETENSRIWVFTFDKGLSRDVFERVLRGATDLEAAKIFLNERVYTGDATYIYRALDGVFDRIEAASTDGKPHDFLVHLFTDGQNNDRSKKSVFQNNVQRFNALRKRPGITLNLYYHGLGVKPEPLTAQLIEQTEGIYFVDGITMPPKARFVPSTEAATDTTPVTFVNKTIGAAERWQWDFGDGVTSVDESPTHVFKEPGSYTVRLTASNKAGPSTAVRQVVVKGGPPKAKFAIEEPEKPKYVGLPVRFVDQSEGRVTAWSWVFGKDEGGSQERNPEHTYKQAGTFQVMLGLTGPYGKDTFSEYVKVSLLPVVTFSFFPEAPKHSQEVKFSNDSVGEYKVWRWDFGDGTQDDTRNPTHTFAKAGSYTVTLIAEAVDGEKRKAQKVVNVASAFIPPEAKFTLPVTAGEIGEAIRIADESTGSITNWFWDFGDGKAAAGRQVEHAYMTSGTHSIELTVSGPAGNDSCKAEIEVKEAALRFSVGNVEPRCRMPIVFVNESVGRFQDHRWDFGDGNSAETDERSVSHDFKEAKAHTVTLTATGPDGKPWTISQQVVVKPAFELLPVVIDFGLATGKATGRVPLEVKIANRCKGSIQSYLWDFGDGTTGDDKDPSHTYDKEGEYALTLTVIDQKDQKFKSTESQAVKIVVLPPPSPWRRVLVGVAIILYLAAIALVKWLPGMHDYRYEVDARDRGRHHRRKDKSFLWQGANPVRKETDSFTDGFKVTMRRDFLLRKRYRCERLKGQVQATKRNGKALKENRLVRGAIVRVGEKHEVVFRKLDDGLLSALFAQLLILVPVVVILTLGLRFLG